MTMEHFTRILVPVITLYFTSFCTILIVRAQHPPHIIDMAAYGELGRPAILSCRLVPSNAKVDWLFKGKLVDVNDRITIKNETKPLNEKDPDGNVKLFQVSNVTISKATPADDGNYTCLVSVGETTVMSYKVLDMSFPAHLESSTEGPLRKIIGDNATLRCIFKIYQLRDVKWQKEGDAEIKTLKPEILNITHIQSTFELADLKRNNNGTFTCQVQDPVTSNTVKGSIDVLVLAEPQVQIDFVKAIGADKLFINWTVNDGNSPITEYILMFRKAGRPDFIYYPKRIDVENTSLVIEELENSTEYQLQLEAKNAFGKSINKYHTTVKTLEKDPIFVPHISINGFTATSVTIGLATPPEDVAEYIHYYELVAQKTNDSAIKKAIHSRDSRNLPYMFGNLEPFSTYYFKVRACSDFTKLCGEWSDSMKAVTGDGTPGPPSNVTIHCHSADVRTRYLNITWDPPLKPNAEIKGYTIEIIGRSLFKNREGEFQTDMWNPPAKVVTDTSRSARFDDLKPNTNFTVKLSAMTRMRKRGEEVTRQCYTPPAPPDEQLRPRWHKILNAQKYYLKLVLPRISERNGPIMCYRVFMVRLPHRFPLKNLPPPKDINLITYEMAHESTHPPIGAYAADIFSNLDYPDSSEIILGDNVTTAYHKNINAVCKQNNKKHISNVQSTTFPPYTSTVTTIPQGEENDENVSVTSPIMIIASDNDKKEKPEYNTKEEETAPNNKIKRSLDKIYDYRMSKFSHYEGVVNDPIMRDIKAESLMMKNSMKEDLPTEETLQVKDGSLDSESNYTLFVELIAGEKEEEIIYSEYLNELRPAPSPPLPRPVNVVEIALQVTCGILAVILLSMIIFCILHTRRTRKLPPNAVEMNSLQATLRSIYQGLKGGRHQLVNSSPPDMPPIAKEDLAAAYTERQADSDYGFQREFEMLPDCFADRTTHASEARENQAKNRYPDIKAYDQTRVKLSQIDSVLGSDYINANYVMGYKERKKFVCAQGPTETTVNDFWRMIWEQGLELIVMLTNLEEYSKVKCSKYWPDEQRGMRAFGGITVQHVSEKRYSDYIVRELKISKQPTNAEGQPIIENNGIKKSADSNDSDGASAPTSPRDWSKEQPANGTGPSERIVRQYHFLMWKDFAAPEHPQAILKFIKRVNEAWSGLMGRPVLVHCSAGVGRTGTLVALDCLLQQLRTEGQVAVFNTIAELRRQRNFLVQSLKQYVFVYRALVEYAHYGDTEIMASKLKNSVDRLRNTPEGADKCLMEEEFERMSTTPIAEVVKSCAAGAAEELRSRNRSDACLPYDRNRVILTPVPGRDFSTYINASFIEAYDNSESFIITQDPLPSTIADFWRMISEQNVSTIVMLSELGDGDRKCPRYWDDGTVQYEHISVQYEHNESCPYYTRREFRVTNTKSGEVTTVRHLQYHGWPTVSGQVPEVTRGLAEVADAAEPCARLSVPAVHHGPMLVHCNYGTERSSMFVALCILICQLRIDRRVDVSAVSRKVRSQRAHTIDTFLQYEFLHRAILNYAELHNLLEDS